MDLRLATLKAVSFYLLHNVSTLNQRKKFSCVTVVCKHFASYQGYPNYKWDLIRLMKCDFKDFVETNRCTAQSFRYSKHRSKERNLRF
jgi:hypothetical protein